MSTTATHVRAEAPVSLVRRLWQRELTSYPSASRRQRQLGLTVLCTVVLYFMAYVQGAVGTQLISDFRFTFFQFVLLGIIGNAVGAVASLAAGLAERWGRANIVVVGMVVSSALVAFAMPRAGSALAYGVLATLLGLVEGMVLVATPALVRDFSPQVGRAQAMGFWTLGPVLGSLVVTLVSSHTLASHPDWRWQYYVAGTSGFVISALALAFLRELSPGLRDQLVVSERERVLVEARAAGIDPEALLKGHWRQMLRPDIIGASLAISVFLLLYYALVGFLVVYFATVFGWSEAKANSLGNWYWASNAVALVVTGVLSDRLRVRKPFMVFGVALGLVGTVMFAMAATRPDTTYGYFVVSFLFSAVGGGIAYVGWMAAFTETVEKRNPAAIATGLAVWGWTLRSVVSVSLLALVAVVPAASTLVEHGTRVQEIAAAHPAQIEVLSTVPAGALQGLARNPGDVDHQATAIAALTGLARPALREALQFNADHAAEIATAQAISPAVLARLQDPKDSAAVDAAVAQIAAKLGIPAAQAGNRLLALAGADKAQLAYLQEHAAQLTEAQGRLQSLSDIPPADLAYLGAHAADVTQAAADQGTQWQHWWLVCLAGQILFLPCVFLLTGRWSPRRAREDAARHDALVDAEMQALAEGTLPAPRTSIDLEQGTRV